MMDRGEVVKGVFHIPSNYTMRLAQNVAPVQPENIDPTHKFEDVWRWGFDRVDGEENYMHKHCLGCGKSHERAVNHAGSDTFFDFIDPFLMEICTKSLINSVNSED